MRQEGYCSSLLWAILNMSYILKSCRLSSEVVEKWKVCIMLLRGRENLRPPPDLLFHLSCREQSAPGFLVAQEEGVCVCNFFFILSVFPKNNLFPQRFEITSDKHTRRWNSALFSSSKHLLSQLNWQAKLNMKQLKQWLCPMHVWGAHSNHSKCLIL